MNKEELAEKLYNLFDKVEGAYVANVYKNFTLVTIDGQFNLREIAEKLLEELK